MSRRLFVFTWLTIVAVFAAWGVIVQAEGIGLPGQIGPQDSSLPEDDVTRISCAYEGKTYHYDLYIPKGYYAAVDTQVPVIFIASPGGNASMGNAEDWIRSQRWLAVMLVEAQNGPADVNDENFLCAHDDVIQRVRVHDNLKFATGVSGAARMSARFVTFRPGFRGLILQAAGMCSDYSFCEPIEWFLGNKPNLYTFATFGDSDFNLWELDHLKATIPAERFNYEIFPGGHEAAPVKTMDRAFAWLMENIVEEEYAIIGRLMVSDQEFDASELLSGVTISASSGSSVTTGELTWTWWDQEGGYSYTKYSLSVMGAGTHTLSASKEGYLFTPDPRRVSVPPETWDQDFELRLDFDISGRVLESNGTPFAGVQVSAGPEYTATTGVEGEYTLEALPAGTYTLTPALAGYSFQPSSRVVLLPPDAVAQEFAILAAPVSVTLPMSGGSSPAFSLTYTDTQGLPTTLEFPAGAVTLAAALEAYPAAESLTVVLTPTLATGEAGLVFAGHAFDLAVYLGGHLQPGLTFNEPVVASIHYSAADVRRVGDESQLALWRWTGNRWKEAVSTCTPPSTVQRDLVQRVIRVPFCRSSQYALLGPTTPLFLPLVLR